MIRTFMEITPEQIRAARTLLRLEQAELAEKAHVSVVTVRRLEGPAGLDRVSLRGAERLRGQDILADSYLYDEDGLPG